MNVKKINNSALKNKNQPSFAAKISFFDPKAVTLLSKNVKNFLPEFDSKIPEIKQIIVDGYPVDIAIGHFGEDAVGISARINDKNFPTSWGHAFFMFKNKKGQPNTIDGFLGSLRLATKRIKSSPMYKEETIAVSLKKLNAQG